ncbi:MAG: PAS domain-containing protein [Permianibacter sp.]
MSAARFATPLHPRAVLRGSLRVVLAYLAFGVLWILLSDQLLAMLVPAAELPFWQSLKGIVFIAVTALLLFLLVRRQLLTVVLALRASRESEARFRRMFHRANLALIEFDDRELEELLDGWQRQGIVDLRHALQTQPTLHTQALSRLRLTAINPEARRLLGIHGSADNLKLANRLFGPESTLVLADLLQAIRDRQPRFSSELVLQQADASPLVLQLNVGFPHSETGALALLSLTDISAPRRLTERRQLLQSLTQDVSLCADVDSALLLILKRLCHAGEWTFAQIWQPSAEGDVLICHDLFFTEAPELAAFHQASRDFAFMRGRGLPGRVWQSGHSHWLRDVTLDSNFPRAPAAERCGLRTAAAVPLFRNNQLMFVLEFFCPDHRREDRALLELMTAACVQLELVLASKQQLHDLQRAQQHFQLAMNAAEFGFWEWQIASGRVQWSGNVERLFGLGAGSFDGRMESYLALLPTPERATVEQAIAASLRGDSDVFSVQHQMRLGDGQLRWLEGRGRVFRDSAGQPSSMAGTVMDVTDRQLEARLLAVLEHDVNQALPPRQLLSRLAEALAADDVMILSVDDHDALQIQQYWQAGAWLEQLPLPLSSGLTQQLRRSASLHLPAVHAQFPDDALLARRDAQELLALWLQPDDAAAGMLLLLFKRPLVQATRVLTLLQFALPGLTRSSLDQVV